MPGLEALGRSISGLDSVYVDTPGGDSAAVLQLAEPLQSYLQPQGTPLYYRALQPGDYESLREAHIEMFPVDYEDAFFQRVVNRQDGLESMAAVCGQPKGNEQLVGFVTTRAFQLYECDPLDRALLGLSHRLLDHEKVSYILTLGVLPAFRQTGIASGLIQWVVSHAKEARARAVYLHVIAYNTAAIALYQRNSFSEVACREKFYYIWSGRQPDPEQEVYDAFLYAYSIDCSISRSPLNLLILAAAPFRGLIYYLASCLPWSSPRGSYFGGGALPPLENHKPALSPRGGGAAPLNKVPPWLFALFSRKPTVRHH